MEEKRFDRDSGGKAKLFDFWVFSRGNSGFRKHSVRTSVPRLSVQSVCKEQRKRRSSKGREDHGGGLSRGLCGKFYG